MRNGVFFLTAIDAPGGFLFEWWSVFWDIFISRTNEKHSEVAASYIEVRSKSNFEFDLILLLLCSIGFLSMANEEKR